MKNYCFFVFLILILFVTTSNSYAETPPVQLDQKVYHPNARVYITIESPDHNFDSTVIDVIGHTEQYPITISTHNFDLEQYRLFETGSDTGIFTGQVTLTGFKHDYDGDGVFEDTPDLSGRGPLDGRIPADDDDGFTVSFEYSEDETVVGSALVRWNIGEIQWLESSYPTVGGTGIVRVIDTDMNLDPTAKDNFDIDVWSDSDAGGIDLTVTETNVSTGIFEGIVFFTGFDESSGHRLRVALNDIVTAEYEDNTLPDPYTTADDLDITATTLIGNLTPPLERAPASNCRVADAFGNTQNSIMVEQQSQIICDITNGQDREQTFAYLVQVQRENGVTSSLAWLSGTLSPNQSFSPALQWTPDDPETYTITAFVWESVDNPTALSPPVQLSILVTGPPDLDNDGVLNSPDNCPTTPNPDQLDLDNDGVGDVCDTDLDGDNVPNSSDNCLTVPNPNQVDIDNDGIGNACDTDNDNDGRGDLIDNCPTIYNPDQANNDNDIIGNVCDNCPNHSNQNQSDVDNNGVGDVCEPDADGDGVPDVDDICPGFDDNLDADGDGVPDGCDIGSDLGSITFFNNNIRDIISLRFNGQEQLPSVGQIIPPTGGWEFLDVTSGSFSYHVDWGFWNSDGTQQGFYVLDDTDFLSSGEDKIIQLPDVTATQILTQFGSSGTWDNLAVFHQDATSHVYTMRFFDNNSYEFFIDGNLQSSGSITQLSRNLSFTSFSTGIEGTGQVFEGGINMMVMENCRDCFSSNLVNYSYRGP